MEINHQLLNVALNSMRHIKNLSTNKKQRDIVNKEITTLLLAAESLGFKTDYTGGKNGNN